MPGATNGVSLGPPAAHRAGVSGLGERMAIGLNAQFGGITNARGYGFSGFYKIAGTAREQSTLAPLKRTIFLFHVSIPSIVIASTVSNEITGAYVFNNITSGTYTVLGLDPSKVEDDVVHAYITAVPM